MRALLSEEKICKGCKKRYLASGFSARGRLSCSKECESTIRNMNKGTPGELPGEEERDHKKYLEMLRFSFIGDSIDVML